MGTQFASVYNRFLGKITDDMYIELTPQDTIRDLQNLLIDAIPGFEFPRKSLDYTLLSLPTAPNMPIAGFVITSTNGDSHVDASSFIADLTSEEINILAILMMCGWLQRQITSIEVTRMKYSGTDFKMTSQANHLQKLLNALAECQRQSIHMQRLYKRRRTDKNGNIHSNWSVLRENSAVGGYNITDDENIDNENQPSIPTNVIYDGGVI